MAMLIVPGRNSGYPFAEGLPDTPSFAPVKPYAEFVMRTRGGYPEIVQVPELYRSAEIQPPYPDFVMRCIPGLNDGYPLIMKLSGVRRETFSDLYFADHKVKEMNFSGKYIIAAYCNGRKVYGTRYVQE